MDNAPPSAKRPHLVVAHRFGAEDVDEGLRGGGTVADGKLDAVDVFEHGVPPQQVRVS
jgi:hypothetical protein